MQKKVAIIGAGYTGLSCAKKLVDNGIDVTIFEKIDTTPTGEITVYKTDNYNNRLKGAEISLYAREDIKNNMPDMIVDIWKVTEIQSDETVPGKKFKTEITEILEQNYEKINNTIYVRKGE